MSHTLINVAVGALVGGALGGLLGSTRSCEDGGCPLTATPGRGAVYGAVMGILLALSFSSGG